MPRSKLPTVWKAEPHTIAKVEILREYLIRWFQIMGMAKPGRDILYIDGFAGPGHYTNYDQGSPVAALRAAAIAYNSRVVGKDSGKRVAGDIYCAFIEQDNKRFNELKTHLEPFRKVAGIHLHTVEASFVDGLSQLRTQLPDLYSNPLFVFIDPFGATGSPFSVVADILRNPTAEVLINLDADGIDRLVHAAHFGSNSAALDAIFGDHSWTAILGQATSSICTVGDRCRAILNLYKAKLRALRGVNYTFPFEMRSHDDTLNYFLVFASQHPRGLEKMKEAMQTMDQNGTYFFSDARVGQDHLFQFDRPEDYCQHLFDHFRDQSVSYDAVRNYALNESPFINPKAMLKLLEQQGRIDVVSRDLKRRHGTFPDDKIDKIESIQFISTAEQLSFLSAP